MSSLLVMMSFFGFLGCMILYWQTRKTHQATIEVNREMSVKAKIICEIVHEMTMSFQYMTWEMDQCLVRLEQDTSTKSSAENAEPQEQWQPTKTMVSLPIDQDIMVDDCKSVGDCKSIECSAETPNNSQYFHQCSDEHKGLAEKARDNKNTTNATTECETDFDSYLRAVQSVAKEADLVEIARKRNLGVEELRLLLRFQKEPISI